MPRLPADARQLLRSELDYQQRFREHALPRGAIHGDLFRDNVLFERERVSGLLDFYSAADDALLFDVAITANDWCRGADECLDPERTTALLVAYHAGRPFVAEEEQLWPVLLRAAALRFWLSRLREACPRPDKAPQEFELLLRGHRENMAAHAALWTQSIPQKTYVNFAYCLNVAR